MNRFRFSLSFCLELVRRIVQMTYYLPTATGNFRDKQGGIPKILLYLAKQKINKLNAKYCNHIDTKRQI
jgi:hypothetical protein